jgi:hypothetical protein
MKNQTIATLLAGLLALSATQAQARDIFDADWGADGNSCKKDAQCWIEIRKPGKANKYTLKFIVADRFDASKVRCSADATAEKSSRGNFLGGLGRADIVVPISEQLQRPTPNCEERRSSPYWCAAAWKADTRAEAPAGNREPAAR